MLVQLIPGIEKYCIASDSCLSLNIDQYTRNKHKIAGSFFFNAIFLLAFKPQAADYFHLTDLFQYDREHFLVLLLISGIGGMKYTAWLVQNGVKMPDIQTLRVHYPL